MKVLIPVLAGIFVAMFASPVVPVHAGTQSSATSASASMTPAEHQAAAERYAQEAKELRAKSEQHAKTAKMHAKHSGPRNIGQKLQNHCERLAADYAKAASEAEELAGLHRELAAAGN